MQAGHRYSQNVLKERKKKIVHQAATDNFIEISEFISTQSNCKEVVL